MVSGTYFITPQGGSAISSTAKPSSSSSPSSPGRAPHITGTGRGEAAHLSELWATRVPALQPPVCPPGTRILYGLVLCLLCPESVCLQLSAEQVWCGWREIMGILLVTPYPPDLSMSVMCECVESWSRGVPPHPPPGLRASSGLHLGSSLHSCTRCLSRCQNSVLLRGLNFWKPIKMCLLWVGSRASGCRPHPLFGALPPPC